MSFGLPSVKVRPEANTEFSFNEGSYGIPNVLSSGFASSKTQIEGSHPLCKSEKNHAGNQQHLNMALLRNTQGLHAPMRIAMELKAVRNVGRLPFLESSNALSDALLGRDLEIGFEDVLGAPEFDEVAGQPHAVMERTLGIM